MDLLKNFLKFKIIILLNLFVYSYSIADNHNIYEILDQLQNDIKTLEKAVYSQSTQLENNDNNVTNNLTSNNSEDVLTRHLLKFYLLVCFNCNRSSVFLPR